MATTSQGTSNGLLESGLRELGLLLRAVHQSCSQPVALTDDDRRCLGSSFGFNRLVGLSRDRLIERRLDDFVAPGFRPQLERHWAQFLDKGELADSYPLLVSGGAEQLVGCVARARVLPGQHLLVLRPAVRPQRAGKPEQIAKLVPSWVQDAALLLLDAEGNVAAWYSGAERMYGYAGPEAVGRHLSFLYDDDLAASESQKELAKAQSVGRLASEGWHRAKDGSRLWARVITSALYDESGQLYGFAVIVRDFSDRHGSNGTPTTHFRSRQVRPSSRALVGVVSGEFDEVSDATDGFLKIVGYSREELVGGRPYWPELTPPEYSLQDELAYEEALIHLACTPFEKEYIRKDGTRVRVLITAAVLSAYPFHWVTFAQDLTQSEGTANEKTASEAEPVRLASFAEIVGESSQLQRVFDQIELVAPTDATVLILGETGTGKELTARAIHRLSDRRDQPFISLNCAALPAGLLESELFGYERGAFTGALARKVGRFEMANGGTLFLDEVGDIPVELQPKLLRALQEKEFERLGGTRTIPINVRLLAATNRNLGEMIGRNLFRSDLYYRLNVFPIVMPPLRDHPTDIPLLARYFVQKYAQQMKRDVVAIPAETMRTLVRWSWPGNVRELENFIERSVILSRGTALNAPLAEIRKQNAVHVSGSTLEEVEREHIIHVLQESGGVVSTAAKRLGTPRTTLNAMMRKLDVTRKTL